MHRTRDWQRLYVGHCGRAELERLTRLLVQRVEEKENQARAVELATLHAELALFRDFQTYLGPPGPAVHALGPEQPPECSMRADGRTGSVRERLYTTSRRGRSGPTG
jgi:hypothetical protein